LLRNSIIESHQKQFHDYPELSLRVLFGLGSPLDVLEALAGVGVKVFGVGVVQEKQQSGF
jgi:hypothetical protein